MPQASISTKIILDGEKEYRAALRDIDTELKTLGTELKLSAEQYADSAGSVEALTAKSDILQQQLETQRKKVETLQGALESANETYGEGSRKSQEWQQKLNLAQADLLKMERSLNQTADALEDATAETEDFAESLETMDDAAEDASSGAKGFGDVLNSLTGKLGIDLPDSFTGSLNGLGSLNSGFLQVAAGAAAGVTAFVAVTKALTDMVGESAQAAKTLRNLSQTTGLSTESAQKWDHVLRSVGSSLESASGDLSGLQQKMSEAATGSGEAAELFAALGVSVKDTSGALKTTDQLLPELISSLQEMEDTTQRNAIASKLLGSTGSALIPIYNQTGQELQTLIAEKEEMGIMTEQEVDKLAEAAEAQERYTQTIEAAKAKLSEALAPAVTSIYDTMGKIITKIADILERSGIMEWIGSLVSAIFKVIDSIMGVVDAVTKVFDSIGFFDGFIEAATGALSFIADTLGVILGAVEGLLSADWSSFQEALASFGKSESGDESDVEKKYGRGKDGYIRSGTNIYNERTGLWEGNYQIDSLIPATIEPIDKLPNSFVDEDSGVVWRIKSGGNASGTDYWTGGVTWVGENGPEKVYLPEGSRIQTAQESRAETVVYNITIPARDIKEFNDIVRIAKNARRAERMGMA